MGSVLALNGAEVLLGGVCPFQDFGGPSNQSALVLIRGVNGSYGAYHSLPEVCEVTPFITTIRVQYGGTIVNISDVVNKRPLNTDGSNWPLLVMSAQILAEVFYTSQDMVDNAFMSGIASAMDPAPYSNNFGPVLENYLRGIMEYSGTGVRTSADNEAADIPDEMLIPLNGTMYVTTMGWQYSASIHLSALASMSIIWGLTMYAVAMDYLENRAERKVHNPPEPPVYVAKESFHPSDSLHVILASGSGGLSEALRARSARSPPDYETLRVRLGVQEDGTAVLTTKE
ncbi:hypothetical protein PAXINDRAFT_166605 [Paxillus involutus ATCC 200175]|nr:hypothetical protein PAXINDRAFT_166605 [Paxillus involutus ATCC 200175]